jgi:hypothetical protein
LDLELHFTASLRGGSSIQGCGKVVNISSNGVAFRTETTLLPGLNIVAKVEWPVALNGECLLRVAMEGRIVRVENGLAAMSAHGHKFRTGGRAPKPVSSDPEAPKLGFRASGALPISGSEQYGTVVDAVAGYTEDSCSG